MSSLHLVGKKTYFQVFFAPLLDQLKGMSVYMINICYGLVCALREDSQCAGDEG